MTNKIEITSFQGGLANDKNAGQEGAFWNSKNIEFRRNSAYVELNKGVSTQFSISTGAGTPRAMTFWGNQSSIGTDIVLFTSGGIYTSAGQQSTIADIINVGTANSKKYFLTTSKLYEYTDPSTNTLKHTFAASSDYRPTLDFFGDLIIGDGNKVARWTEAGAMVVYPTALTVGGLDGTVYAITQVGANIHIWCNNGTNTNMYIWDGASENPSQAIKTADKPIMNVALLSNMHYWWSAKSSNSIREVLLVDSYQPQLYIKSDYPYNISTDADAERNRMGIYVDANYYTNAIETMGDIVYLPGYGRIFGFGKYLPGQSYSFATDFGFTGGYVTCMASGGITGSGKDAGGMLGFCARNGSNFDVNVVNLGQSGAVGLPVIYSLTGFIETMEFIAPNFAEGEQSKKLLVPYELPSANTSIVVYAKRDRGSYETLKTITSADGTGYHVAEINYSGKWRTIQFKFELVTTSTTETPKLYTNITNLSEICGNKL